MSMIFGASSKPQSMEISAVKILADGTRVDLGVLTRWHRNPFVRLVWRIQDALGGSRNER